MVQAARNPAYLRSLLAAVAEFRAEFENGHYPQAVATAAEALVQQVKSRTRRSDKALWQEVFSDRDPEPGKPRLRWPGDQNDRTVKSMNDGLRQFAPGAQMTIRNPSAHLQGNMTEQAATERLAVLSLLAGWVEECELVEAPDPSADTA